jgi:hypothetical protein
MYSFEARATAIVSQSDFTHCGRRNIKSPTLAALSSLRKSIETSSMPSSVSLQALRVKYYLFQGPKWLGKKVIGTGKLAYLEADISLSNLARLMEIAG